MILRALRLIGEKEQAGTLTTTEQTNYLADLNTMLDSWSLERLMVYQILQENFALTNNVISYTIGSGGTFNTVRPIKITRAFVRDTSSYDSPITILDYDRYDAIRVKTVGTSYPEYLYYDAAFVAGLATIKVYPAPSSGLTLYIDSWKQLQSFATISTTLVLPPGYQRAIEYNFAIEVTSGLKPASAEVIAIAKQSKDAIKKVNLPSSILQLDAGVVRRRSGSILTGP